MNSQIRNRYRGSKILETALLVVFLLGFQYGQSQDEDVFLQAFDWNVQNQPAGRTWYQVVDENIAELRNAGIDAIWMPPPSNSAAPQGYLPRELYDLNSAYGTERQLRNLISKANRNRIKVLADIVINHRVGSSDAVTFENPDWPTFFITADDEGPRFVDFPVPLSINGDYVPGRSLKADGSNGTFAAARDLDHFNPAVRREIIRWMRFLKNDVGFDGWRYDFVHGYDPIFNKEYNDATQPYFAVGELLESSRVQTNNWVNFTQRSSSAFDFNTKVSLQNALRDRNLSYLRDFQGNASGMIGINPSKSVTFLDNHDTGSAQQCCGSGFVFPEDETSLRQGYAYILTHPGNPMVFWTHFFDRGRSVRNTIRDLIAIRKDVRIHAGTTMNIVEARRDLYAAYIDGRNGTIAMKLGAADWSPFGEGWVLRTSGNNYAVWTQGGSAVPEPSQEFTVFVRNLRSTYTWDATGATSGRWPGKPMQSLGNNWYSATVPGPCTNIIFSSNGRSQTRDLRGCADAPYFYNNRWNVQPPASFPRGAKKIDSVTDANTVTVYPNPFQNIIQIENGSGNLEDIQFTLMNISGQVVHSQMITAKDEQTFSIESSGFPVGLYFYTLHNAKTILKQGKLSKQ